MDLTLTAGSAPVASNGTLNSFRGKAANGFLKASDAEGDTLSFSVLSQPPAGQGSITLNGNGSYTYTPPNGGFSGSTSFSYRVNDGSSNSNTATVNIAVANEPAPPPRLADLDLTPYASTPGEDAANANALLGYALGQDTGDIQGLIANWNLLTPARAKLFFTFDLGFSGNRAGSAISGSVSAFTAAQKDAARAVLAHATTLTGIPFEETSDANAADFHFGRADLLGSSVAGITLNFTSYSFSGTTISRYDAESIVLLDNAEWAQLNTFPVAGDGGYEVLLHEVGHALGLGHPFEAAPGRTLPAHEDNTDNTVMSYTRSGDFKSIFQPYDRLALRWIYGEDGLGGNFGLNSFFGPSLTLTPTTGVAPTLVSPIADARIRAGKAYVFVVPAETFADADSPSLSYSATLASGAALPAWLSFDAGTRRFSGTPAEADVALLELRLTARDEGSLSASDSFMLAVERNAAPLSAGVSGTTSEDTPLAATLPAAIDANGDSIVYAKASEPAHGSASVDADGRYRYTPAANFSGSDSFQFRVSDDQLSSLYSVSITVTAVNDAPVATAGNASGAEDQALSGSVRASDVDSIQLTFAVASPPGHGTLTMKADGNWRYEPEPNFNGIDAFSFTASDGVGNSAPAVVNLSITPVNDAPTGALSIVGAALVGQPLTVASTLQDADGLGSFRYRWLHEGGSVALGSEERYTPGAADVGRRLLVEVSFTDGGGTLETRRSETSGIVQTSGQISGSDAAERLVGTAQRDLIDARGGADTLLGEAGDDTLDGGAGDDSIDGGAGFDTARYSQRSSAVVASLALGSATLGAELDLLFGIEALAGGLAADVLEGDGAANHLDGEAGNDSLAGAGGDDTLVAGDGNDTLAGGAGIDWADYGSGAIAIAADLGAGTVSSRSAGEMGLKADRLIGIENLRGSPLDDRLDAGTAAATVLDGGAGADTLVGSAFDDTLIGGAGPDSINGGEGYDVLIYGGAVAIDADLARGIGRVAAIDDLLAAIEGVVGSSAADRLTGIDDIGGRLGQLFKGLGGDDTIAGGAGVDQAHYRGTRAEYTVTRDTTADTIRVVHQVGSSSVVGADGIDALAGIERLRFGDQLLAFGSRAEEVARVAFVLWTPEIAPSSGLWARGLSFYDAGYGYRTLVQTALLFHPDSDAELAVKLIRGTPGTPRTAAELITLMATNGGGENGRIAAVTAMAESAQTYEQVRLAGFATNGIVADLNFGDTVLFVALPDGPG